MITSTDSTKLVPSEPVTVADAVLTPGAAYVCCPNSNAPLLQAPFTEPADVVPSRNTILTVYCVPAVGMQGACRHAACLRTSPGYV